VVGAGVPEVEGAVADLGVGARLGGGAGPGVVGGLADVVLQFVEGLDGDGDDGVRTGLAEVFADVGAGTADAVVALLAREAPFVGGVPQHAVSGLDVEAGRDDRGQAAGEERGQGIDVHSGDYGGRRGWRATPAGDSLA
jgi:hypothetical protein